MPIVRLTRKQYFVLTGKERGIRTMERHRKLNVAAFGMAEPLTLPFLVDVVAVRIVDDLVDIGLARREAVVIVRSYFDHWITAVSRAEHRGEATFFAVVQRSSDDWKVFSGKATPVLQSHLNTGTRALFLVDIPDVMKRIKERAKEAGIDLPGSFFLPDDHPVFQQWIDDFRKWRDKALRPDTGRKMRNIPMVEGVACHAH